MISSYRGHVDRWLGSRSENVVIAELRLSANLGRWPRLGKRLGLWPGMSNGLQRPKIITQRTRLHAGGPTQLMPVPSRLRVRFPEHVMHHVHSRFKMRSAQISRIPGS